MADIDFLTDKIKFMEKRTLGIILSIVGIAGLVAAFLCITGFEGGDHVGELLGCGIVGTVIFFVGVRLFPDASVSAKAEKK
ncbi:MAG TPA: hypothetical protein VGM30_05780 [Puia sp.]|jgi:hypothetical protein